MHYVSITLISVTIAWFALLVANGKLVLYYIE